MFSCQLEQLTSMRECKLTVLSWCYFLTILCIDKYSCLLKQSCEAMSIKAKQPNIFAACINIGTATPFQKPFNAYFDVHIELVQYILRTLFVDFRCSDPKDSRIVCLHIQNIVMIILKTYKCILTFFQRYS